MHVRGVTLRSPLTITLDPGQVMQLTGQVTGCNNKHALTLSTRSSELLPAGLHILSAEVDELNVCVKLHNASKRPVSLDQQVVFAELHYKDSNGEPDLEALVGPSHEADITVEGCKARCLIDSGSQVSIVTESFYRQNLANVPLQQLDCDLKVTGAGGQQVPYLGFVGVDVSLPSDVVGMDEIVNVLMLVCPDNDFSRRVPVIIGTNALRHFADSYLHTPDVRSAHTLSICPEVAFMFHDLSSGNDGKVGSVKVRNSPVLIKAGETVEVKCSARLKVPKTRDSVLIQEPIDTSLPEGLKVVGCKTATHFLPDVKIVVINESENDILLAKNQVIADAFVYQHEYDVNRVLRELGPESGDSDTTVFSGSTQCENDCTDDNIEFKFDKDASQEWCSNFKARLQSYSDVFIKGEFDIGRAKVYEPFDINLEPGPDVRERARPIPPRDFEECKQHIEGLLEAKVIRPSNSPFAPNSIGQEKEWYFEDVY